MPKSGDTITVPVICAGYVNEKAKVVPCGKTIGYVQITYEEYLGKNPESSGHCAECVRLQKKAWGLD